MSCRPLLPRRRKDELAPGHRNCARALRMFVHGAVAVTAKFRRSTDIMSSRFSFGETASDSNGHGCIHIATDKIESVTIEGNENILNAGITVYDIIWKFLVWTVRWPVCISVFINGKRGPSCQIQVDLKHVFHTHSTRQLPHIVYPEEQIPKHDE